MTAYLYDAIRTPRGKGKADGALAGVAPHDLVRGLIDALRQRTDAGIIERAKKLTLGCVGQVASQGGHIALVSRLAAKLPDEMVTHTVNNYCVSSLSAIGASVERARPGELELAGGVESMSQVPFMADKASFYSDPALAAKLSYVPVALAADLLATEHGISKEELDAVTLESHRRAAQAWEEARFTNAVVPITIPITTPNTVPKTRAGEGDVVSRDETIRASLTDERLAALPPAFAGLGKNGFDKIMIEATNVDSIDHVHSIANCPPIADGAAMVSIGGPDCGLEPRAKVLAFAETSGDPIRQLTAGFAAMTRVLADAGMTAADCESIEFMEAFAATPALFLRQLSESKLDVARVNPDGGHLAMGHPMGASGAILVSQLLDSMTRRDLSTGLVVCHGGSGVGAAMIIERV